jgi:molybdenum cofactor biosynthesis enzyme MoaA
MKAPRMSDNPDQDKLSRVRRYMSRKVHCCLMPNKRLPVPKSPRRHNAERIRQVSVSCPKKQAAITVG